MSWSLGQPSAPGSPVVSTADAKAHLRVVGSADDDYIATLVLAATYYVQQYTGRLVYSQTITEYADAFPSVAEMPLHCYPITSLVLKYYDSTDTLTTLSASEYWAHTTKKPCTVETKSAWPSTENRAAAVRVEITGGDSTPLADIKHAIKIIVGHWYEQPDETSINVPAAAKALLLQHRLFR